MVDFPMPPVSCYVEGWGPPPGAETAPGICDFVEHLDKFPLARIGRICDFTASGQRFQAERGKGKGKGFKGKALPTAPGKDDEGFSLVDSRPLTGKSTGRGRSAPFGRGKGRGKALAANYQEGILGQKQKPMPQNQNQNKGKSKGKGNRMGRGQPSFKEWSVKTETDWEIRSEITLSSLPRLQIDASGVKVEDLLWCGKLHDYNKDFDRITVKTERPLRRFETLNFFNVTTSDDPNLPDLLQNDSDATVIATDHVLACLIAASRSIYSWDILVQKISNKLIFDKRDNTQIDLLTVNETAAEHQQPNNDDPNHVNSPMKLGMEASCINQNFSQMVLDTDKHPKEMEYPNPFEEEEEGMAASGAYRYRKFTLPGNPKADNEQEQSPISIICRTEVNCKMPGGDDFGFVKALNEYEPGMANSWRNRLESQRGACFATELKNNSFKLGRWTAQAILAGCTTIKLGYVSRQTPGDPWNHSVLSVHTYQTDTFAETIEMKRNNMFGILRSIIDLLMTWDDGKYLILKDPTKAVMRIYDVPWTTFMDEEGEEEGDGQDQEYQEGDEEGNAPAPS
jgi:translation initiation factor 3 subunit D